MTTQIQEEKAREIAIMFCNKQSISSWKKREALTALIIEIFYFGYECGIDDLHDKIKAHNQLLRTTLETAGHS